MSVKERAKMGMPMPGMLKPGAEQKPISRIMFDKYDVDGDSSIGPKEFKDLCYDLGHYLSEQELEFGLQSLDKDGSGAIEYNEFLEWWRNNDRFEMLKLDDAALAKRVDASATFRQFDDDNSGTIDANEFEGLHALLLERGFCPEDKVRYWRPFIVRHGLLLLCSNA
eukprot:TRINITY_DN1461_c0_g1_i2.p2 TRINITY_DN1461_c0_g1~~TRINITY_DN1461_c0_g1_i2.p2  ORF type:complete len:167 (-),score=53.54 TRINITY_DN1461_c0_g1_i2:320-820(-)